MTTIMTDTLPSPAATALETVRALAADPALTAQIAPWLSAPLRDLVPAAMCSWDFGDIADQVAADVQANGTAYDRERLRRDLLTALATLEGC